MKKLLPTILFSLYSIFILSQYGLYNYGPNGFQEIAHSLDSNLLVIGSNKESFAWLVKMDKKQNIQWQKSLKGPSGEHTKAYKIIENEDSTLFIIGSTFDSSPMEENFGWLIKLDKTGNVLWNKIFDKATLLFTLCKNGRNGYYLGGTLNPRGINIYGVVIQIADNGNYINHFEYVVSEQTQIKYLELLPDSSLLIIGRASELKVGYEGLFFVRRNLDGTEKFRITYNTNYSEDDYYKSYHQFPLNPIKRSNGNYLMVNPNNDCLVLEFDPIGKIVSTKVYGERTISEFPFGIIELKNGDFLISGFTKDFGNLGYKYGPVAIRINSTGKELWKKYFDKLAIPFLLFNAVELGSEDLIFAGVSPESNAILFRTLKNGELNNNRIIGKVYYDINSNCKVDSLDLPLKNVIVKNQQDNFEYAATDENGIFTLRSDRFRTSVKVFPTDEFMEYCEAEKQVAIDFNSKIGEVEFLMKPKDQCPHLGVQITQPDLVKCRKAKYFVTVKNYGVTKSEMDEVQVQYDSRLKPIDYTTGGQLVNDRVKFSIPALDPLQEVNYEVTMQLDCDAVIGASHMVTASINGSICGSTSARPKIELNTECKGDNAGVTIFNNGITMDKPVFYRIFLDQYQVDYKSFMLQNGQTIALNYPTAGKAFYIELDDTEQVLSPDEYIYSYLEGCGRDHLNLFSNSYSNAFRKYSSSRKSSQSMVSNTIGVPDHIQEMISGLGAHHFINKNDWMEFTVQANNKLDQTVSNIQLELKFTTNFDVTSFQLLSCNGRTKISFIDSARIIIDIDQIILLGRNEETGKELFLKFKIKPIENAPFDKSNLSDLTVQGKVFYGDNGPHGLLFGHNTLTKSIPYIPKKEEYYEDNINIIGSRYYTFGSDICEAEDESKFLLLSSSSYNKGGYSDPLVIKLDKNHKSVWLTSLKQTNARSGSIQSIVSTEDGGCIMAGSNFGQDGNRVCEVIKLNMDGAVEYTKLIKPGNNTLGGYSNRIIRSKDGNYLVTGYCQTSELGYDNFLLKINSKGEVLWNKEYIVDGLAFNGNNIFELANGDIIVTGADDNRDLVCVLKTNSNGEKIWLKTASPQLNNDINIPEAVVTKNEEIVFCTYANWKDLNTNEYYTTPHFIRLNKLGNYVDERRPILGIVGRSSPLSVKLDKDGNYVLFGSIHFDPNSNASMAMIAKFDLNFDLIWYKGFGIGRSETFYSGIVDKNERIHAIGNNQGYGPTFSIQGIYLNTDSEGNLVSNISDEDKTQEQIFAYPNPADEHLYLFSSEQIMDQSKQWTMFSIDGKQLLQGILKDNDRISLAGISDGIYYIKFKDPNITNLKILVQH
jgi:hypothetical protein